MRQHANTPSACDGSIRHMSFPLASQSLPSASRLGLGDVLGLGFPHVTATAIPRAGGERIVHSLRHPRGFAQVKLVVEYVEHHQAELPAWRIHERLVRQQHLPPRNTRSTLTQGTKTPGGSPQPTWGNPVSTVATENRTETATSQSSTHVASKCPSRTHQQKQHRMAGNPRHVEGKPIELPYRPSVATQYATSCKPQSAHNDHCTAHTCTPHRGMCSQPWTSGSAGNHRYQGQVSHRTRKHSLAHARYQVQKHRVEFA